MSEDIYDTHNLSRSAPPRGGVEVQLSDTGDLPYLTKCLFVGNSGSARVTMADGTVLNFTHLAKGVPIWVSVRRVHATGTTASGIVALW